MTAKALLSIVLPAFNEEGNILPLAAELAEALPALAPWAVECVFVDDGSTDATRGEMIAARNRHPALGVRIVALDGNHGLTAAMDAGFKAAAARWSPRWTPTGRTIPGICPASSPSSGAPTWSSGSGSAGRTPSSSA